MMSEATKQHTDASADASSEAIEAVIADSGNPDAGDEKQARKNSKGGLLLIILLLLVVAIATGLHLTGQLPPLYESALARLNQMIQADQIQNDQTQAEQIKNDYIATSQDQKQAQTQQQSEPPQAAVNASPTDAVLDVNSDEVSALLSTMDHLRTEMQQLEASQQALQSGLIEQQQMNTQVRLRWIADSASRLPQMQLAWEEISLLPGLSEGQRQQAMEMHALARRNVQRLKQWQGELQKWADALTTPIHHNIMPQPEHPWLAWIVGQFQLRQAPTQEARHLADLRSRLLDSARQLTLESWPRQGAWQRLHAELLLQIKAMQVHQSDGVSNDTNIETAVETGLPVDFSGIAQDITTLREAARAWDIDTPTGATL